MVFNQLMSICQEILVIVQEKLLALMPFLSRAIHKLVPAAKDDISLATDGNSMFYDSTALLNAYRQDPNYVLHAVMHVLLHCLCRHMMIGRMVDPGLWNLACDMEVEAIIVDLNLPRMLSDRAQPKMPNVVSLTAERIYRYFIEHPLTPDELAEYQRAYSIDDHSLWYSKSLDEDQDKASEECEDAQNDHNADDCDDNDEDDSLWHALDGSGDDEEDGQSISDDEQKCCESDSKSDAESEHGKNHADTASPATGEKNASEESAEAEDLTSEEGGGTEDLASDGSGETDNLASDGSGGTEGLASDGSGGRDDPASDGSSGTEDLASEGCGGAEDLASVGCGRTEDLASDGSGGTEGLASDGSGGTEDLASDGSGGTEDLASDGSGGTEGFASDESGGTEDLASDGSGGTEDLASELALCRSRASANQEKLWEDIASTIAMDLETFSRQYGTHAGNLIQSLRTIKRETVDYSAFLRKFATHAEVMRVSQEEFDLNYYTYGLKLYRNTPLIEPLEYRDDKQIRELVIGIDTSGSVAGDLVQAYLQKTWNIIKQQDCFHRRFVLHIIQCDSRIQEDAVIVSQEDFDRYIKALKIHGGGGTDFRPVFEHVNRLCREGKLRRLKGLLYFTDGYGTYPTKAPDYKTAFVFLEKDNNAFSKVPPWAMKVILTESEILQDGRKTS